MHLAWWDASFVQCPSAAFSVPWVCITASHTSPCSAAKVLFPSCIRTPRASVQPLCQCWMRWGNYCWDNCSSLVLLLVCCCVKLLACRCVKMGWCAVGDVGLGEGQVMVRALKSVVFVPVAVRMLVEASFHPMQKR